MSRTNRETAGQYAFSSIKNRHCQDLVERGRLYLI